MPMIEFVSFGRREDGSLAGQDGTKDGQLVDVTEEVERAVGRVGISSCARVCAAHHGRGDAQRTF
jgi:hypothetical protein